MSIAKGVGKPLRVDANFERARFARVCVEVDLRKPLKGSVLVNGARYYVAYEGLNTICSRCGLYGHLVHTCPQGGVGNPVEGEVGASREVMRREVTTPEGDGFTQVKRSGRGARQPVRSAGAVAGSQGGERRRNLREIPKIKGPENITVSNIFGRLSEDILAEKEREVVGCNEENKENESRGSNLRKGNNGSRGFVVGKVDNKRDGPKGRPNTRWAGVLKPTEIQGTNSKSRQRQPMTGLIFGPTEGELRLSESGKRMRIEQDGLDRAGGIVIADRNGEVGDKVLN